MRLLMWMLVAGLAACDGNDDEGCLLVSVWPDEDNDGYGDASAGPDEVCIAEADGVTNGNDCNDLNFDINPRTIWYRDQDGDGFGISTDSEQQCEQPDGYVLASNGEDCNDTRSDIFPDTYYVDNDQDGYGADGSGFQACDPKGYVVDAPGDCNDADPAINPGQNEICADGIDNNCNREVDDADTTARWYPDNDGDGFGNQLGDEYYEGCVGAPDDYTQVIGECDDTDPDLNWENNTRDCILEHCGEVLVDEVWKNTVTHHLLCDVEVGGTQRPTLSVVPGATVLGYPATSLLVGVDAEGSLEVNGTPDAPVNFSSYVPNPVADGDHWTGIVIGDVDGGSYLRDAAISYAGYNGNRFAPALVLDQPELLLAPELTGVRITNNLEDGLQVDSGEPVVVDCEFSDNKQIGVDVSEGAGLGRFEDNTLTGNEARQLVVPGGYVHVVDLTNYIGDTTTPEFEVVTGTLRVTGTWYDHSRNRDDEDPKNDELIEYVLALGDTVDVQDGPQAHLTIEDGVNIQFDSGSELRIGDREEGTLYFEDGDLGVVFTGTVLARTKEQWEGLTFGPFDGGSLVRNLLIEYGGADGRGNLYVDDSAPTITDVLSQNSDSAGLWVSGRNAAPEITFSEFRNNDTDGVHVEASSGIARSVKGPTFVGNVLTDNGGASAVFPPNFIGELDPTTTFANNAERIGIHGGDVLRDATWRKLDEDYEIRGDMEIAGPQDPVVTIEPAVALYFRRDYRFRVGISEDGSLVIDAANDPVVMTSADVAPGPGDWEGLEIGRTGLFAVDTSINGLQIQYAGGTGLDADGAIELVDRDSCQSQEPEVNLNNVEILDSSKYGLFLDRWTTVRAIGLTIDGSLDGCYGVANTNCPEPTIEFQNNDCRVGQAFGQFPLSQLDELDATSTYPGGIVILEDELAVDVTIPNLGVPFIFTEEVDIIGLSDPTMTVSSGVELQFDSGAGLVVAGNGPDDLGSLVLQNNVVLTSSAAAPSAGDWEGIRLRGECRTVDIDGATISYAGANGQGAVWVDTCPEGTLQNTTITDSVTCGVALDDTNIVPTNMTYTNITGDDECVL